MIKIYKKLVRDNIPDICISNNQIPDYRVLDYGIKQICRINSY